MEVFCMNDEVKGSDFVYCGDMAELCDYEIEAFKSAGADVVYYWYSTGCYEGQGNAIFRIKSGEWYAPNLGHCSCYGPTDDLKNGGTNSLDEWKDKCSSDSWKEIRILVEAAQKQGYK